LEDQEVADADVMTRDGDGIGRTAALNHSNILSDSAAWARAVIVVNVNLFPNGAAMMMRVKKAVGGLFDPMTERMVVTVLIVVTHLCSIRLRRINNGLLDFDVTPSTRFYDGVFVFVLFCRGSLNSMTILAFGNVNLRFSPLGSWATVDLDVSCRVVSMRFSSFLISLSGNFYVGEMITAWSGVTTFLLVDDGLRLPTRMMMTTTLFLVDDGCLLPTWMMTTTIFFLVDSDFLFDALLVTRWLFAASR
jgi:hypothetical protein